MCSLPFLNQLITKIDQKSQTRAQQCSLDPYLSYK